TRRIRSLGEKAGVTVTGYVNDVRPYLSMASACVAPLRIARGLQNKVLEAMAMGRAVVATHAAFEGIRALAGRDLLVADDEGEFAAAVLELLQTARRRGEMERNARRCVEQHYSWRHNLQLLDELFSGARPTRPSIQSSMPARPDRAQHPAVT